MTSSSFTTSRCSTSSRTASARSRRCCAGTIRRAAGSQPVEFIPVAEDTGLIVPIGAWVIREACTQAARWPEHIRVAVNVSPVQFHRGALNETILRALADSGLAPGRLEVEITESIFLEGSEATLEAASFAALARRARRARRFRDRLFVAELFAELPVRQIEDRPQLHPESADPRGRERDRPRHHRACARAQHRDHRRRASRRPRS